MNNEDNVVFDVKEKKFYIQFIVPKLTLFRKISKVGNEWQMLELLYGE